jgi:hypothetical protein
MNNAVRVAAATAAIGIAALSPTAPAHAGDAVGAGIIGFGVGALIGSLLTPPEVYVGPPPPPYYYGPVVYGPPPPYYYYEDDYYGPPGHRYRPPAAHATHETPTPDDQPQPKTAKASRDDVGP